MIRLSDPKVNGEYPFQYTPACATDIRRHAATEKPASFTEAERILADIKLLRDAYPIGEIRSALNAASDRMDVACSKIYEASRWQK